MNRKLSVFAIIMALILVSSTVSFATGTSSTVKDSSKSTVVQAANGVSPSISELKQDKDSGIGTEAKAIKKRAKKKTYTKPYTRPFPTLPDAGDTIANTAIKLAWPYGTPGHVYSYKRGSSTPAFQKAIDQVFPHRSWGPKAQVGASCDVFVATVLHYSGYDTKVPRGVTPDLKYFPRATNKWTETGISRVADMEPGDVILWSKSSGTKHICIYVEINGVGYLAEAHYMSGKYGCIDKKAFNYSPGKYKHFGVYRANAKFRGSLERGYVGTSVAYLQNFLNWAGYDCGTADGSFGKQTMKAVKAFQKDAGLTADGKFGSQSLKAAKSFVPVKASATHRYKGIFPKVGKRGLQYRTKSIQVKRMQKFLNWYGLSKLKTDGEFGKNTRTAVKKFQKAEKLKVDGEFGKACLKRAKSIKK